jgi:nicotinate-nucleotide adenylyltransferase
MGKTIYLYDGSFNPITLGHKLLINSLLKDYDAKKVFVAPMPNFYRAIKPELVDIQHRINMIKNLNIPGVEVLNISCLFNLETFSLKGLLDFLSRVLCLEIIPVIGLDVLADIENWYNGEELLQSYNVMVFNRNDDNLVEIVDNSKLLSKYKDKIIVTNIIANEISSTKVRNRIDQFYEDQCEDLIANSTFNYIKENNLYV